MSEKDVYIGETSIQIGQHGFINQPKEIIEYIKYLQNQLQQKENIIKEVREYIKFLKEHYEELRTNPIEDSYFINDMLRQMFIQSIEHYLLGIEDILDKELINSAN